MEPIKSIEKLNSVSVEQHVQLVLSEMLSDSKNHKNARRILSKKMGIHEKTFLRLLHFENKPSAPTVLKIYKTYYNKFNDADVLDLVPKEVSEFLKENLVLSYSEPAQATYSESVDDDIQNNPVFAEIYVLAATGPIGLDEIQYRYGLFGTETLKQMLKRDILKELRANYFVLGGNQASFANLTVLKTGLLLAKNYGDAHSGQVLDNNFISFFAEGLSNEGYQKWIKIDQEAFQKKVELSKKPENLGSIRAFCFQVVEKMNVKNDLASEEYHEIN